MMKFGRYGQFKKAALSLTSAMLLFAIMLPSWAMAADGQTPIALTQQEQSYIQSIGIVRVGQLRNRYPLSNFAQETGELTGVHEDVLTLLSQKTGLRFEQTPLELNEKPVEVILNFFAEWQRENTRIRGANRRIFSIKKKVQPDFQAGFAAEDLSIFGRKYNSKSRLLSKIDFRDKCSQLLDKPEHKIV